MSPSGAHRPQDGSSGTPPAKWYATRPASSANTTLSAGSGRSRIAATPSAAVRARSRLKNGASGETGLRRIRQSIKYASPSVLSRNITTPRSDSSRSASVVPPNRTLIGSLRCRACTHVPCSSSSSVPRVRSRITCIAAVSPAVTPHATCSLWPSVTPGVPASAAPPTCMPGALASIRYQMPGTPMSRCGSFASTALPTVVRSAPTAQALLPVGGRSSPPFDKLRMTFEVATVVIEVATVVIEIAQGDTGAETVPGATRVLLSLSKRGVGAGAGEVGEVGDRAGRAAVGRDVVVRVGQRVERVGPRLAEMSRT